MPGPATVTTIISLYPDAGMNNVTPNYITATAPIQLGWYGQTPPERRIVAYDVYYRNRSAGQPWQSKKFGANDERGVPVRRQPTGAGVVGV